jgi:hypothetical protein
MGKRYPEKYNRNPDFSEYYEGVDKALTYLRPHQAEIKYHEELRLWKKEEDDPSVRPEVNDAW